MATVSDGMKLGCGLFLLKFGMGLLLLLVMGVGCVTCGMLTAPKSASSLAVPVHQHSAKKTPRH